MKRSSFKAKKSDLEPGQDAYSEIDLQLAYRFLDGVFSHELSEESENNDDGDNEDNNIPPPLAVSRAVSQALPPTRVEIIRRRPSQLRVASSSTSAATYPLQQQEPPLPPARLHRQNRPQSLDQDTLRSLSNVSRRASVALGDVSSYAGPSPGAPSFASDEPDSDGDRITVLLSPRTAVSSATSTSHHSLRVDSPPPLASSSSSSFSANHFPRSPSTLASYSYSSSTTEEKNKGRQRDAQTVVSVSSVSSSATPRVSASDDSGSLITRSSGSSHNYPPPRGFRLKSDPSLEELRNLDASEQEVCCNIYIYFVAV
jgi:hypothetical protein